MPNLLAQVDAQAVWAAFGRGARRYSSGTMSAFSVSPSQRSIAKVTGSLNRRGPTLPGLM